VNTPIIDRLAVLGVGLIGGSVALALKQAGQVGTVIGVGRNPRALDTAIKLGAIDQAADVKQAVSTADMVLLATPVGQFPSIMQALVPYLKPDAIITDAGSTKRDVAASAREHLGKSLSRFVPAHPIAGAEKSGVGAAKADMFLGKHVVLTPLPETSPDAIELVEAMWQACGAKISQMTPLMHDQVFAAVSHLPHLLAFALVAEFANRSNAEQLFEYAAGGFRDFTRIAGSSPEMWRDISLANKQPLLKELKAYQDQIVYLAALLERGDGDALNDLFQQASAARNKLNKPLGN
jgi:prephenate dehydrogenase